jgi:DNA (cytosine-5)-methyltransferase 1
MQGHMLPVAFGWQNSASQGDSVSEHVTPTLDKSKTPAVCGTMLSRQSSGGFSNSIDHAAAGYMIPVTETAVRRLTPRECERLQGFPDDYTLTPHRGKPAADGPRYKALGNSMAVPVMRWIGERIEMVDKL